MSAKCLRSSGTAAAAFGERDRRGRTAMRDGEDRVGAEPRLVRRAVERDQRPIELDPGSNARPRERVVDLPLTYAPPPCGTRARGSARDRRRAAPAPRPCRSTRRTAPTRCRRPARKAHVACTVGRPRLSRISVASSRSTIGIRLLGPIDCRRQTRGSDRARRRRRSHQRRRRHRPDDGARRPTGIRASIARRRDPTGTRAMRTAGNARAEQAAEGVPHASPAPRMLPQRARKRRPLHVRGTSARTGSPPPRSDSVRRQVMRLAQQMRQREAEVERGVAEVDHLVVEQHQPAVVDEDVLRAVVAVHEREPAAARCRRSGDRRTAPPRGPASRCSA